MQILRHHGDVTEAQRGAVVVLGNFDGVHRGHQAVFERAAEIARKMNAPLAALTFEPHPRSYFRPGDPPFRLTPFRNKAHHLEALGLDFLLVLHFDAALSRMTAGEFTDDVLAGGLKVGHVVVGYDFVFGHRRGGDVDFLRAAGDRHGFGVTVVEPVSGGGEIYSSTRIRDYLQQGKPAAAAALLGRPFEIEGRVAHGNALGRDLGYPTANLGLGEYLLPAYGIYAVRVGIAAEDGAPVWHDGVASFGIRPTIGEDDEPVFEAYIFDFVGDLYGMHLRVQLIEYIRPEAKFDGLEALTAQIEADCREARRILDERAE